MATTYTSAVQQLYVAYFNRPADPAGLDFWAKAIASANGSNAAVAAAFSTAVEYTDAYKGMTNAQIVDQVYQNLFGRGTANDSGADFWIKGLNDKTITIADVVTAVAAGAQGTDLVAFNNKVTAATAFTNALDTDAEVAGYVGTDANEIAREWLAGVTTNGTLSTAILPENLNKVVAEAVAAGTEFTVAGALSGLAAATDAYDAYLESITPATATATWEKADVIQERDDAQTDFVAEFNLLTPGKGTTYAGASAAVKAALIDEQVSANVTALSDAQRDLNTANTAISKTSGLSAAITKLENSEASLEAAVKSAATAQTALDVSKASFVVTAKAAIGTGTVDYTSGVAVKPASGDAIPLIDLKDGVYVLHTGVTETKYPGVTSLLNSLNTDKVADDTVTNLGNNVTANTAAVVAIDKSADAATAAANLKAAIGDDAHTLPSAEDIATYRASLIEAGTDTTSFEALVDAYAAKSLYGAYAAAQAEVTTASQNITDFNKVLADLNTAQQHLDAVLGYEANVTAATEVFGDNDYHLVTADLVTGALSGTADSDVFVINKASGPTASISLFGLQGSDSIYVGEGYSLVKGQVSTTAVSANPGSDTKLEVFVAQQGANTVLSVETSAFGSHTATPEVVTVTLVGVTSTDVHLDANGLITVGTAA